ncbi:MAG: hypothetical protein LC730_02065, partial [Acidobacteria bacterium]|nr:hypothetical protein [Acidobacteriota bacterium]
RLPSRKHGTEIRRENLHGEKLAVYLNCTTLLSQIVSFVIGSVIRIVCHKKGPGKTNLNQIKTSGTMC